MGTDSMDASRRAQRGSTGWPDSCRGLAVGPVQASMGLAPVAAAVSSALGAHRDMDCQSGCRYDIGRQCVGPGSTADLEPRDQQRSQVRMQLILGDKN
jgi:hypothetical protein